MVVYQCQKGFRLWGSSQASCDPVSQQWSGPPTCRGTGAGPTVALNPEYLAPFWISPAADINECEEQTSVCPEHLECVNVPGSFSCSGLFDPAIRSLDEKALSWFLTPSCSFSRGGSRTLAAGCCLRGGCSDGGGWWSSLAAAAALLLPQVRRLLTAPWIL